MKFSERLFRHIRRRYRSLQRKRGVNVCLDLKDLSKPRMIFDVGANVGQSAMKFRRYFPQAHIHCFEPFPVSAQRIRRRALAKVEVHETALGSEAGTAMLSIGDNPALFSVTKQGDHEIRVDTVDAFCRDHGIEYIDFMKIDTEGHDLEVLKGATGMLRSGRIAAVQVEAGMNPENTFHVPFDALKSFLESLDYRLFAFYDQVGEFPSKQPHLRRANPLFVSPRLYQLR